MKCLSGVGPWCEDCMGKIPAEPCDPDKEREQAEAGEQVALADNAALVDGLKDTLEAACEADTELNPLVKNAVAKANRLLSQPHPGDSVREELERLRADAAMRDPNGLWLGECGHIWDIRKSGKECPVCKEIGQAQTEAKRLRTALAVAQSLVLSGDPITQAERITINTALNAGKEDGE
jgi:hypothetical protein